MTDFLTLVKSTSAYKTVKNDKENGTLSHAYMIFCRDGENISEYIKILVKLILCENGEPCNNCRTCRLIDEENFADVFFYPDKTSKNISVKAEDVTDLIEESYVKPLESDKKIFVVSHGESMNATAQNKILKILEEPPKNVHIFIGTTSEFSLLPTVKSRMKRLEIPSFSSEVLFSALKGEYPDGERLKDCIACSDGTVGSVKSLYGDERLNAAEDLAADMTLKMASSRDVLKYAGKIAGSCVDIDEFTTILEILYRDMLAELSGGKPINPGMLKRVSGRHNFSVGALIYAIEKIEEAKKRKTFNVNATMLIDWLLFQILEGKYKWQK